MLRHGWVIPINDLGIDFTFLIFDRAGSLVPVPCFYLLNRNPATSPHNVGAVSIPF